jgi:hypothetical protein
MTRTILSCAIVASIAFAVVVSGAPEPTEMVAPKIAVTILPASGDIPASMANGRPVYEFFVLVSDPDETTAFVNARALLQAGDTKNIRRPFYAGLLTGRVSLSAKGVATYRVEYVRDGKLLAVTSAQIGMSRE